ncbi:MAG: hypothetical protein GY786_00865, partial [Proteobacteria bacterium]|nr:hypothetical protein [Pseudomonadota bacterium]
MVIQESLWESGNSDSKMQTFVKEGSFRVMGGAITKDAPQNFKTETPAATIGIRGSMYAGLYKDENLSVVFEGGQAIYVAKGSQSRDITTPGFGIQISDTDQKIEKPKKFDQQDLNKIENQLASATESDEQKNDSEKKDSEAETVVADSSDGTPEDKTKDDNSGDTAIDSNGQGEDKSSDDGSEESLVVDSSFADQQSTITPETSEQDSSLSESFNTEISAIASETVSGYTDTIKNSDSGSTTEGIITLLLEDLGYTGTKSASVPTSGMSYFKGKLKNHDGEII